ncbi:hypothetical protein NEFER03_0271 [Nematocida sp. LUAm3]|nr:hypothetical protein NEFER03_0271 [Nematocida sp. LUAm3]KAI5173724.1 hypothetical protein NEFER02_0240 [Nematocida sp. LUAm2]KAI5176946.1 hypothetical protein NEFER01_0271 [Nematocida sp. LUAm1]
MQLSVGDAFKSKNEAQNAIRMYAVDNNFNFETTDSTPKKYTIQCKEKRTYGCDAIITAALRKKDNLFVIKKLKNMHNCPQQPACAVQSSSRYIVDELREMEDIEESRVGQIINRISLRRGIKIGYLAAWKAKNDVLDIHVPEEKEQEECLQNIIQENRHINPDDVTAGYNMKEKIEEMQEEGRYIISEEKGFISQVVNSLGLLEVVDSSLDTFFYICSLSLHVYKYSRQIIELISYTRYNDLREYVGNAYFAVGYDAFDAPYIIAMGYTPEYCSKGTGWVLFIKELLKSIDQGVLMIDWNDGETAIKNIEQEIEKKNAKNASKEPVEWAGHFDIEESIRMGELDQLSGEKSKVSLFIRTRSLCKEIFSTYPCTSTIALIWSLCNSPDLATFTMYYKQVKAKNVPSLLSLLSSLPTHLWAKYLCPYPLYNKNNISIPEIDAILGMLSLAHVDAFCMVLKIIADSAMKKKELIAHSELTIKKSTDRSRFGESINREMDSNISKAQTYEVDVGRAPGSGYKSSWIDPRKLNDEEEHGQGMVYADSLRFYVDLRLRVCSCMKFQEMGYPCSHACALIAKTGGHAYAYIDEIYSIDTLTHMFKPAITKCIVNEPIKGLEERRKTETSKMQTENGEDDEEENIPPEMHDNMVRQEIHQIQ